MWQTPGCPPRSSFFIITEFSAWPFKGDMDAGAITSVLFYFILIF